MDLNKTVDHAKTLSKQLKAVMEIAEILDEVKNLQQFVAEARKKAKEAKQDRDKAVSMREAAEVALANLETKKQVCEEQAKRVLINAEVSRQTISDRAESDRKELMLQVNKVVIELKEQAERDRVAHNVNMSKWKEEEKALQKSLLEYTTALADIKQRIG